MNRRQLIFSTALLAAPGLRGSEQAPAPLYRDPNYHGSCDPEIVWNSHAREWWIFYTARRATREKATYVGTPIGVAASKNWINWRFAGYCSFDGVEGKPDMPTTSWAPGVIRAGDEYHMFVTRKDNANPPWGGHGGIVHYCAPASDLLGGWKMVNALRFGQPDPIDATLLKVDGEYRVWYRVEQGGGIQWSTSADLADWKNLGKAPGDVNDQAVNDLNYQEAPYVFEWRNRYWMLTDPHRGLAAYSSRDAVTWKLEGRILEEPGTRRHDNTRARHPSVAVVGHRAFLFYHVEPWRTYNKGPEERTTQEKRSFLQMAELELDGGVLSCDRNREFVPPVFNGEAGLG